MTFEIVNSFGSHLLCVVFLIRCGNVLGKTTCSWDPLNSLWSLYAWDNQVWWLLTKGLVIPAVNSCLTFVSCYDHCYTIQTGAMSEVPFETWPIQRAKHLGNWAERSTVCLSKEQWKW